MEIPILAKRPDFVALATVYSWEYSRHASRCQNQLLDTMKWSYDMILSWYNCSKLVNLTLIYVIKFQRLNLSCCISQNTSTYCICNKFTSWCNLNFVLCSHGNAIYQRERMTLFHILRLLSNNNLYFARSCILHILTQDSSLHACAKFHYCTLAYVRDMNQLPVIFDWPS